MGETDLRSGTRAQPHWAAIATYFGVACAVSLALARWPAASNIQAYGYGPLAGALVAWVVFGRRGGGVTLTGGAPLWAAGYCLLPAVAAWAVGRGAGHSHLAGLAFGLGQIVYSFGEEAGWRGFLNDALRPLGTAGRVLAGGGLWYLWHWTFYADYLRDPASGAAFLGMILLGAWGLSAVADRTRSVLVATGFHAVFKLPPAVSLPCLAVGVLVVSRWPPRRAAAPAAPPEAAPGTRRR